MEDKKILYGIESQDLYLISNGKPSDGFDGYGTKIPIYSLYFDGEKPKTTYKENWYSLTKKPTKIERIIKKRVNERYVLDDYAMECDKFPKEIKLDDVDKYPYDVHDYYSRKYDNQFDEFEDITDEFYIHNLMFVDNLKMPDEWRYDARDESGWTKRDINIGLKNVTYSLIDKIVFPNILHHTRPCKMTGDKLYEILREYVKDNINNDYAKIESDYAFVFEVKKRVKLKEPETISYTNPFARTKKEKNKIHYKTKTHETFTILSVSPKHGERGTLIKPIFGKNTDDLKNNIDKWLKSIIEVINSPVEICPHCAGTGHTGVERTDVNNREFMINPEDLVITVGEDNNNQVYPNETSNKVAIKHIPTGIKVECNDEKSQLKNKEKCIEMLVDELSEVK